MPFWPNDKKNARLIPQVQAVPKAKLHYTVTPIGGKERLEAWKLHQARQETAWQAKQAPIRARQRKAAIAIVDMSLNPPSPSYQDKRETKWLDRWLKPNNSTQPINKKVLKESFMSKVKGFVFKALFNKSSKNS